MPKLPPQSPQITYVHIPVEINDPIQERSLTVVEGKEVECLTDTLKAHFQQHGGDGGSGPDPSIIAAISAQLEAKHGPGAAAKIDPALLAQFAGQQMVEITAVQPGTKANGFSSTNLYSDDQGVAKKLPVNVRACGMAAACGMSLQVSGDAFLSRVYDDGEDFR